jgi:ubiquinone/menaquinone biosynthesis C-methylase UbiE
MRDLPNKQSIATATQDLNQGWWESNPMTYEWGGANPHPPMSREWFEEIDRRFFSSAVSFFAHDARDPRPFAKFIPYDALRGKKVLEVGCGSGAHTRMLAAAGADVTAIDLTQFAIDTTRRRLQVFGERADVVRMDAEQLEFPDASFDFVWSWGVIHHTAHMDRAIREIARVLKPDGETRFMIYHRRSLLALWVIVRARFDSQLRNMSRDDVLSHWMDGSVARFYTRDRLDAELAPYYAQRRYVVCGQKHEIFPIPGKGRLAGLKRALVDRTPDLLAGPVLRHFGSFLFAVAAKRSAR